MVQFRTKDLHEEASHTPIMPDPIDPKSCKPINKYTRIHKTGHLLQGDHTGLRPSEKGWYMVIV